MKLTAGHVSIEKDPPCQIKPIPGIRPFNIMARFDRHLDETTWYSPLTKLGMDIVIVSSKPKFKTATEYAQKKEIHSRLRLREGEN